MKYKFNEESKPNTFAIAQLLKLLFKDKQFDEDKIPKEIIKYFKKQ